VYGLAIVDDQILLVRARSLDAEHSEVWWLPGGGIDFLEAPLEALAREVLEETGLEVTDATLFDVVGDSWIRRNGEVAHAVRIIYTVSVTEGELRHEQEGSTSEARWVPLVELDKMTLAPYARDAVRASTQTK
jgi:ADP-ribose pyrophosphatase YjhB (NUDIX family)